MKSYFFNNSSETECEELSKKTLKDETSGSQDVENSAETFYMTMRNLATLAHAITGGIESPLQFCIQVYYIVYNISVQEYLLPGYSSILNR